MKQLLTLLALLTFLFNLAFANTGDTIEVISHNKMNMGWYGNYDDIAVFPPATKTYHKILMHYILGCASGGCSGWDYTTIIYMMQHTGTYDSTLSLVPNFTENGTTRDTFSFSTDTTWVTKFDTTSLSTDSTASLPILVRLYSDTTHPYTQTDSQFVFPVGYWNYYFDSAGNKIDSAKTVGNQTWYTYYTHVYSPPFEKLQPHEMGRVITPYGSYYTSIPNWNHDYVFDVTDYAPLLHDSVLLRDFYSGWSNGFSVTLKFEMIEGTPPRNVINIHPLYDGYWGYGGGDNINNHLPPMTFSLTSGETNALLRFTPTGHGSDNTNGCSEFCSKFYDVSINDNLIAEDNVWRSDCGFNALWHQSGTWPYDRANWCPGAKGLRHDYEIPPSLFTTNSGIKVGINFEDYTSPGGPGYQIGAELFTYGPPARQTDATIDDVIQPNNDGAFARFNPACANPKVVLRNLGALPLTSVRIHYGFEGEMNYDYSWNGNLAFNETETVTLPNIIMNDSTPSHVFKVYTHLPNGAEDQYHYNDTVSTYADFPKKLDSLVILLLKTNLDSTENAWYLFNDKGDTLYGNEASQYQPNKVYRDTFHLTPGCYQLELNDAGGDGLDLNWFNHRGVGYAKIAQVGTGLATTLPPDFGSKFLYNFMVGHPELPAQINTAIKATITKAYFKVYPNPNNGNFTADVALPNSEALQIEIYNSIGEMVWSRLEDGFTSGSININLGAMPAGLYFIKLKTQTENITRKIVLNR